MTSQLWRKFVFVTDFAKNWNFIPSYFKIDKSKKFIIYLKKDSSNILNNLKKQKTYLTRFSLSVKDVQHVCQWEEIARSTKTNSFYFKGSNFHQANEETKRNGVSRNCQPTRKKMMGHPTKYRPPFSHFDSPSHFESPEQNRRRY